MGDAAGGPDVGPLLPDDPEHVDGYRLVGRLGEGGQGRVYLAESPDGEQVAVKVLLPGTAADPGVRQQIARQLELTRFLPGTAVVRVLADHLDATPPYLVSEYVPGPSLATRVRRSGPLRDADLDQLMVATLDALARVHQEGVVHNDLKPSNILLGPGGPRIADFDIAQRIGARDPLAEQDGVLGSAAFMAPERLDARPAVRASDLFAWAATMVFAACGRSPFRAPDVAGVVHAVEHDPPDVTGVPARLRPLLAACLDKDPQRRPTADRAVERLTAALQAPPPATGSATGSATGGATSGTGIPAWGTAPAPAAHTPAAHTPAAHTPAAHTPAAHTAAAHTAAAHTAAAHTATPATSATGSTRAAKSAAPRLAPLLLPLIFGIVIAAPYLADWLSPSSGGAGTADPSSQAASAAAEPTAASAPTTTEYGADLVVSGSTVLRLVASDGTLRRFGLDGSAVGDPTVSLQLLDHQQVLAARFSADGRTVAVATAEAGADGVQFLDVGLWNTQDGRRIDSLPAPPTGVIVTPGGSLHVEVAVSADGSVIAWGMRASIGPGAAFRVVARRVGDGAPLLDVTRSDLSDGGLVLSPDGRWLAYQLSAATDDPGRTWVLDLRRPSAPGTDLGVTCDGPIAFVSRPEAAMPSVLCRQRFSVLWVALGGRRVELPQLACRGVTPMAVSPDGTSVACDDVVSAAGHDDHRVQVTGLDPALAVHEEGLGSQVPDALAWTADGDRLLVGFPYLAFQVVPRS